MQKNEGGNAVKRRRDEDPTRFFNGNIFLPTRLAAELSSKYKFIASPIDSAGKGAHLLYYQQGVYVDGRAVARTLANQLLGELSTTRRIGEAVELLNETVKMPHDWLNPNALKFINVKNGMLDWRSGDLLPHSPEHLSTVRIDAEYDPDARSSDVDRFLTEVLPEDALPLAEEMAGYVVLPTTRYQRAFMLVGGGNNGKSTFLKMLTRLWGEENVSSVSLQALSDNHFMVAELLGKLANVYADLPSRALEESSIFKCIVTGDEITAERKFGAPFRFAPTARLLFSANDPPSSSDSSDAFFRRWVIIPFPHVFEEGRADAAILDRLITPHAKKALLNHALAGLRRLEDQHGFSKCESVQIATRDYRQLCDPIFAFANEKLVPTMGSVLSRDEVHKKYVGWCREHSTRPAEKVRAFNKRLVEILRVKEGRQVTPDGLHRPRVWEGLAWKIPEPEDLELGSRSDHKRPARPGSSHLTYRLQSPGEAECREPGQAGQSRQS